MKYSIIAPYVRASMWYIIFAFNILEVYTGLPERYKPSMIDYNIKVRIAGELGIVHSLPTGNINMAVKGQTPYCLLASRSFSLNALFPIILCRPCVYPIGKPFHPTRVIA